MTISPSIGKKFQVAFTFVIVICAFILTQSLGKWSWIIAVIYILPFTLRIRQGIATGRTFLFTPEGITIKFMWYSRIIKWSEISYVGIFDSNDYFEFCCLYAKGIEFWATNRNQ